MAKTEQKQRKEGSITASSCKPQPATKMKRMRKGMPRVSPPQRSSIYRGVTRHRWTGRYEAHLWDKNCWNETQSKKGKQVYLGAYDDEEAAAHAYDLAAMKYWGQDTTLNFPVSTYEKEFKEMEAQSKEEYIGYLRRKSSGFSRGVSKFRGVARHHHNGRWEARIGRVLGNKYLYLGTYATQEEAAIAYDMAAIHHRGLNAVTNFDLSRYVDMIKPNEDGKNNPSDSQLTPNVDGENNTVTSPNEVENNAVTSPSDEMEVNFIPNEVENNAVTSPSDEMEVNFIDDQQQTSSSTNETPQNLPDSPGGAISSSTLELMLHSPKYEEILERTSVYDCFPMKSDSRKSIFPEEIQTYFDCQNPNSYVEGEDGIFGDLNSFVSSMFEFELDV